MAVSEIFFATNQSNVGHNAINEYEVVEVDDNETEAEATPLSSEMRHYAVISEC